MVEITIDENVCQKDGLCAMTCTFGIFQQEEKGTIPKIDDGMLEKCYRCGHCVAICPHGAISHSHFQKGTVNPINIENLPSYDQVLELIRSRRSKRLFKDTPVERDVLEMVLEAARFAPSQHNDQSTEFVVIRDKKILYEITALTAGGSFAGVNANLALHNAALAAETVGLGCFYAGFAEHWQWDTPG